MYSGAAHASASSAGHGAATTALSTGIPAELVMTRTGRGVEVAEQLLRESSGNLVPVWHTSVGLMSAYTAIWSRTESRLAGYRLAPAMQSLA